jgi:hypothetical protein
MKNAMGPTPAVMDEMARERAREVKDRPRFKCETCGILFSSQDELEAHQKEHVTKDARK